MTANRALAVHGGLLVAALLAALLVWTRDEKPKALAAAETVVWPGRAAEVERVLFTGKGRTVTLEAKKDDGGRYFTGTVHRDAAPPAADAGDGASTQPAATPAVTSFVSVGGGEKLAETLLPLRALRALGKLAGDKVGDFGLAEPEGTLTVLASGKERSLHVGASTPGGGDRYVRDVQSGELFVVKGEVVRDLEAAESRLVERELHGWKEPDVVAARVTSAGRVRELVRGGAEGKRFWADPADRERNDETAGNWMAKLDRLRPGEYVPTPSKPIEPGDIVVRVDYRGASGNLGFLELARLPGEKDKSDYLVRSERTRLFAKVPASAAEQVEQDVGAVVK